MAYSFRNVLGGRVKVFSVQRLTKAAAVGSFCARLSLSLSSFCV